MNNDNHVSNPPYPPHKNRPLQFKRGTARAFYKANPILLEGEPAFEIDSLRFKIGNGRTRYIDLPYIGESKDGKSAYEIWIDAGHEGSVEDFLNSLIGPSGESTYEIWLSLGHEGSLEDFIDYIKGEDGRSAFDVWRYDYMHDPSLTLDDYMDYLRTTTWSSFDPVPPNPDDEG